MFKFPFGVIRCFNQTLVAIVATDRLPVHCLFLGDVRGAIALKSSLRNVQPRPDRGSPLLATVKATFV